MIELRRRFAIFLLAFLLLAPSLAFAQQQVDSATVVRGVDSSVKNRIDRLAGYTVTEHYAVYRGNDETHQAADMVVKTTYRRETGKSYEIVSQSGGTVWRNEVLGTLLENERRMSQPANVGAALINSSNYDMRLEANAHEQFNGRDCLLLDISPKRNSEYLFRGKLWVDARDFSIVQLRGTASKSAFFLASAAEVVRQYDEMNGLPMATHAQAVSGSSLLGQTVVKIDYTNYQLDLKPDN
jgi:outer membrane lipoprotein-sorting protein